MTVSQPRAADGTFTERGQTAATLTLTSSDIQAFREAGARYVLEAFGDLDISNHGAGRRTTVTLADMGEADIARGNCSAMTTAIIEDIGAPEFSADRLTVVSIRGHVSHVALAIRDPSGDYVVDYTARQFSGALPFPLVASFDDWKIAIETATGRCWDVFEDQTTCNSCGDDIRDRRTFNGMCDDCMVEAS